MMNRQIVLRRRPQGLPQSSDFELVERDIPQVGERQVLVRHQFLGLAPAARLRMSDAKSYTAPTPIGGVIYGQAAGVVVQSNHPSFAAGEQVVVVDGGWQDYSVSRSGSLTKASAGMRRK